MAGGRASERVRQGLVIAQVALTIVLLVGAGLLARSFIALMAVDPGYRTDRRVAARHCSGRSRAIRRSQLRRKTVATGAARRGCAALPGVQSAGLISAYPLGGGFFPTVSSSR